MTLRIAWPWYDVSGAVQRPRREKALEALTSDIRLHRSFSHFKLLRLLCERMLAAVANEMQFLGFFFRAGARKAFDKRRICAPRAKGGASVYTPLFRHQGCIGAYRHFPETLLIGARYRRCSGPVSPRTLSAGSRYAVANTTELPEAKDHPPFATTREGPAMERSAEARTRS